MIDISNFEEELKKYINRCNQKFDKQYSAKIEIEQIDILNEDGESISKINFGSDEIKRELNAVQNYDLGKGTVAGDDFINAILYDKANMVNSGVSIRLLEGMNGTIKKSYENLGVLLLNINKTFELVDFTNDNYDLEALVRQDVLVGMNPYDDNRNELDIENIDKFIYSALVAFAHENGIVLDFADYENEDKMFLEEDKEIPVKLVHNIECIRYYLSAEGIKQEHFKYVEYYHVLEYFFLYDSIKKIKRTINEAITAKLIATEWNDDSYYRFFMQLYNHYFDKHGENNELKQLKRVIREEVGFSLLKDIVLQVELNPRWLGDMLFADNKTQVNIKQYYDSSNKMFKANLKEEDKERFCDEISQRIYAVRNYCVHSKKSEESNLLLPIPEKLKDLKNDLLLIRQISYAIITLMG